MSLPSVVPVVAALFLAVFSSASAPTSADPVELPPGHPAIDGVDVAPYQLPAWHPRVERDLPPCHPSMEGLDGAPDGLPAWHPRVDDRDDALPRWHPPVEGLDAAPDGLPSWHPRIPRDDRGAQPPALPPGHPSLLYGPDIEVIEV